MIRRIMPRIPLAVGAALLGVAALLTPATAAPAVTPAAPDVYVGSAAWHTTLPGSHAPSVAGPLVQATSRNWAGYAVTSLDGSTYNHVHASWTQRAVTCPAADAWAVFWVGFDGWTNGTVEQGGSSARCINSTPVYELWWEMFPTNAIQPVLTISAGDSVSADVTFDAATAKYTITVADATKHTSFTTSQSCASNLTCSRGSAEWIVEVPGHFGASTFFPLANYGQALMNNTVARDDAGNSGSMTASSRWQRTRIQEQDATTTYATTGLASTNGQNFAVTWAHQ